MNPLNLPKLYFFRKKWRKANKHNYTIPVSLFDPKKVEVGNFTYGNLNVVFFGSDKESLKIGNFCSIAHGVKFLCGGEHTSKSFSTFPFEYYFKNEVSAVTKGPIVIKDDVWIGTDSIILSGVTIGQGAIIAADSLVNKDVPPYAVVGGVPAKVIKMRFNDEIVNVLKDIDFSKITKELALKYYDLFTNKEISLENALKLKKIINNQK